MYKILDGRCGRRAAVFPMSRAQGFTLIEIAIVLVIIGLLLGGVIKGQELITSARVHNLADQHSSVQAAYFAFMDRYRSVPGDMSNENARRAIGGAVTPGSNYGGNGNGQLDDGNVKEVAALWHQMAAAGFIQGSYLGGATNSRDYIQADMAPKNPFGGSMLLARLDEYLDTSGAVPVRLGFVFGKQIPVKVLHELDLKIDDGRPDKGSLRASTQTARGSSGYGGLELSGAENCVERAGGDWIWNVSAEAQDCNAVFLY